MIDDDDDYYYYKMIITCLQEQLGRKATPLAHM